ncbi:hypothetical protein B0H34DRAFT_536561 [Crassisporium funariophilum]|nr:hypothetical protein B0H34DRAFT_536561 [Crassisporium funariophilum]
MASSAKAPQKPTVSGPSAAGTPIPSRGLPTRAEINALMVGERGLVDSAEKARHWLDTKGWILEGEPYNRTKLVQLLMTAALCLSTRSPDPKPDVRNVIVSVAFLLEDDITDNVSDALADAVATKTLARIEAVTAKLTDTAEFIAASNSTQAKATLAIKSASDHLSKVSSSLDLIVTKLSQDTPPTQPSWATIAAARPPALPLTPSPRMSSTPMPPTSKHWSSNVSSAPPARSSSRSTLKTTRSPSTDPQPASMPSGSASTRK